MGENKTPAIPNCTITRMLYANKTKAPMPTLDNNGVCKGVMKGSTPYAICRKCAVFKI